MKNTNKISKKDKDKCGNIFLDAKLQSEYVIKTISSLTFDELQSIQLSNKDLKGWHFPIATELMRRALPVIATVVIGSVILNIISNIDYQAKKLRC